MPRRAKTSLSMDGDLRMVVAHRCIDLHMDISDAVDIALRAWLKDPSSAQSVDGDMIKVPRVPALLRPLLLGIIETYSVPGAIEELFAKPVAAKLQPVGGPKLINGK